MRTLLFQLLLPFIAILSIKKPFYGLLIYIAANIIRPEMLFWGGQQGDIIFKLSIGCTIIGYLLQKKETTIKITGCREFWLALWVYLAICASLVFAEISLHTRAWYFATEFLKLWVLVWLILGIVTNRMLLIRMQDLILGVVSLLSLWGVDQYFRGNERLEGLGGTAFGDSNGVAAFGVLFFPIALNKLLTGENRKQQAFGAVATCLILLMIIFTSSRGGLVGLVGGSLYLFLTTRKKKNMAVLVTMAVLVGIPFLTGEYKDRMSTIAIGTGEQRDYSSGSRLVMWQVGILVFKDNPFFGVGLLNFARAKDPYRNSLAGTVDPDLLDFTFREYKVGHSTYFCQLLAEGGLFLTIPYFWLILALFFKAFLAKKGVAACEGNKSLFDLLTGLKAGIFGHCLSILFIDALMMPFLVIQIVFGGQIIRIMNLKEKKTIISN